MQFGAPVPDSPPHHSAITQYESYTTNRQSRWLRCRESQDVKGSQGKMAQAGDAPPALFSFLPARRSPLINTHAHATHPQSATHPHGGHLAKIKGLQSQLFPSQAALRWTSCQDKGASNPSSFPRRRRRTARTTTTEKQKRWATADTGGTATRQMAVRARMEAAESQTDTATTMMSLRATTRVARALHCKIFQVFGF
ncbi:hypothetical protein VYU27_001650 [Nannochloropsis oceanica]